MPRRKETSLTNKVAQIMFEDALSKEPDKKKLENVYASLSSNDGLVNVSNLITEYFGGPGEKTTKPKIIELKKKTGSWSVHASPLHRALKKLLIGHLGLDEDKESKKDIDLYLKKDEDGESHLSSAG